MPSAPLTLNAAQQAALVAPGNRLLIGPPGCGKTLLLTRIAAQALATGIPAQKIALTTFGWRATAQLKLAAAADPALQALTYAPLADWILPIVQAAAKAKNDERITPASNNEIRRLLLGLVASQQFAGTLLEAENFIRSARNRAKKLPDSDPNFGFYQAYTDFLKSRKLADRADLFRRHLLGLRSTDPATHLPPLPVSLLLIDHIHDATELQLLWLKEQIAAGLTVVAAGNDDLTAFAPAGAQGAHAFEVIAGWSNNERAITRHDLTEHYRLPDGLTPASLKVARFLASRSGIAEGKTTNQTPAVLTVQSFENAVEEHRWLADETVSLAAANPTAGYTIGVITPDDLTASLLSHLLAKRGLGAGQVGCLARPLWEEPTAQAVLALLAVLFNQATTTHVLLTLVAMGLPAAVVRSWVEQQLITPEWLRNDLPLPDAALAELPAETRARWEKIQRTLRFARQALSGQLLEPRAVFRATLSEVLAALPADPARREREQKIALLAADTLLNLDVDFAEALQKLGQEVLPTGTEKITVTPVREARNLQFDAVLVAGLGGSLPADVPALDHLRRRFYLAVTRTRQTLLLAHTGTAQPWVGELQQALKNAQRLQK